MILGLMTGVVFAGTPSTAKLKAPVIAFIDFDKAGQEFLELKTLLQEYQADAEYYNSLLKPLEDEITRLRNLGDSSTTYQLKVNEYQLQQQKYVNQLKTKYDPLAEAKQKRLLELAKDYARINGIDILLTKVVAIFVSDVFDVTDDFIKYANSKASR
jgi:Skp family chaperone for outer membrane proteins